MIRFPFSEIMLAQLTQSISQATLTTSYEKARAKSDDNSGGDDKNGR